MRLHPDDIDAVARRVLDLQGDTRGQGYVDAGAVAGLLSVSLDFVRDHSAELGGVKLGDGPRAPLRFDLERVNAYVEERRLGRRPGPVKAKAGARRGRPRKADFDPHKILPLPEWAK